MARYILDSDIFIQAHRMHYPMDVVPGFWRKLIELGDKDIIGSIDKVKLELSEEQSDPLSDWILNKLPNSFFKNTEDSIGSYAEVAQWANSKEQYKSIAIEEFLSTDYSDSWLIAYAKEHHLTVVTHEISEPNSKKKIKIPDACSPFKVPCINLINMFRQIGETF